jgi:hypothetical protein
MKFIGAPLIAVAGLYLLDPATLGRSIHASSSTNDRPDQAFDGHLGTGRRSLYNPSSNDADNSMKRTASLTGLLSRYQSSLPWVHRPFRDARRRRKPGRRIERIAVAFEAGRDGFWLARWLRAAASRPTLTDCGCSRLAAATHLFLLHGLQV